MIDGRDEGVDCDGLAVGEVACQAVVLTVVLHFFLTCFTL